MITTVRSQDKAQKIHDAHSDLGKDKLETAIVPDIAKEGAFDEVVKTPGIDVVLHTASPFHFKISASAPQFRSPSPSPFFFFLTPPPPPYLTHKCYLPADPQKDLIDPAVIGTTGILKAIAKSAPSVKRVVITSSFAAIIDAAKASDPSANFNEKSWNPVTIDQIHENPGTAYRASKTLAEKAAWDFVNDKANNVKFDLATVNPPLVFGPVVHHLASLDSINTSNERLVGIVQGKWKQETLPETGIFLWVDVRDVAEAHVRAFEKPELGGKRLFTTAGYFSNREILAAVRKNFPELKDKLPAEDVTGGDYPPKDKLLGFDNSETTKSTGIQWTPLEKTVTDTVKSLLPFVN